MGNGREQARTGEHLEGQSRVARITDENYKVFTQSPIAVLVVSTSWCHFCEEFRPTVERLTQTLPQIEFGEAVLDLGHLTKLKRDFKDYGIAEWGVPTTILMKNGESIGKFEGALPYETALEAIEDRLKNYDGIQPKQSTSGIRNLASVVVNKILRK